MVRKNLSRFGRLAFSYDYILLDTLGGTDVTSVSTALVAGAFILVTEGVRVGL